MNSTSSPPPFISDEIRAIFGTSQSGGDGLSMIRHFGTSQVEVILNGDKITLSEAEVQQMLSALKTNPKEWTHFVWKCDYQHTKDFKKAFVNFASLYEGGESQVRPPLDDLKQIIQLALNSFRVWHFGQAPTLLLIDRSVLQSCRIPGYNLSQSKTVFGVPIIVADLGNEAFRFVA